MAQVKRLEDMFTVPTEKLKAITDRFVSELEKGKLYTSNAQNIP